MMMLMMMMLKEVAMWCEYADMGDCWQDSLIVTKMRRRRMMKMKWKMIGRPIALPIEIVLLSALIDWIGTKDQEERVIAAGVGCMCGDIQ